MSFLCTLLHSPYIESVIQNMPIYIQAILPASCFTEHSIALLVVDIISVSPSSWDWHIVGLILPSVCETWWGVCLFHLYFIERNIFLSSQDLYRPGLLKELNSYFYTTAPNRTSCLLRPHPNVDFPGSTGLSLLHKSCKENFCWGTIITTSSTHKSSNMALWTEYWEFMGIISSCVAKYKSSMGPIL